MFQLRPRLPSRLIPRVRTLGVALPAGLLLALAACGQSKPTRFCYGDGLCVEPDGQLVLEDGRPLCELNNTCQGGDGGGGTGDAGGGGGGENGPGDSGGGGEVDISGCDCRAQGNPADVDGDCIPDASETASLPGNFDSDNDLIPDGCEDFDQDGVLDPGEFNPMNPDTDGDGIPDGVEDSNHNGIWEPGESDGRRADTDLDGIVDGDEDKNGNGVVDPWVDVNNNGCFDGGDTPGETSPLAIKLDSDDDGILDGIEDKNKNGTCDLGETCPFLTDTDCDGIADGTEDRNKNGVINTGETNPLSNDTDADGLPDGLEDSNSNGAWDQGLETDPRSQDTDGDGIPDGVEDRNLDGLWTSGDENANGCWDQGEAEGESDPRRADTDADGVSDSGEDLDRNGRCRTLPGGGLGEMCAFASDSDCDGLLDGFEDANKNGSYQVGELNGLSADTDYDGLTDGCPPGTANCLACDTCEDRNNNGTVDLDIDGEPTETSPKIADSDGDDLPDGCERTFNDCTTPGCGTNPLNNDSDGDGASDGDEDTNHNCRIDSGETDPRDFDEPPPVDTEGRARFNVCAANNLKRLTFAGSGAVQPWDYKLALEVERDILTTTCSVPADCNGADSRCQNGACLCEDANADGTNVCVAQGSYHVRPFGRDGNANGFNTEEEVDTLWGHVFQSPRGVIRDTVTNEVVFRDVYGFVVIGEDGRNLTDVLDGIRSTLEGAYGSGTGLVEQVEDVTPRTTHDSLTNFEILRSLRKFRVTLSASQTALGLRNDILLNRFLLDGLGAPMTPDPLDVPPTIDPVYGPVICPSTRCYTRYSLYVTTVQRLDQRGPNNLPVVITTVALTPDDTNVPGATERARRLFADREARLEDLTGGSALARDAAELGQFCDQLPATQALADILWVVDDSRSMQQLIDRLQRAAVDAKAILTANSEIVDFRVALTTTNPSVTGRTQCPTNCDSNCQDANAGDDGGSDKKDSSCVGATLTINGCASEVLGCIKTCPGAGCVLGDCSETICSSSGANNPNYCPGGNCTLAGAELDTAIANLNFSLPGGGGSFYFEDSQFLDCDSRNFNSGDSSAYLTAFVNPCFSGTGGTWNFGEAKTTYAEFADFFADAAGGRKAIVENAGFLSSEPNPAGGTCELSLMDLSYRSLDTGTTCAANSPFCCERLTTECADGPTVLGSQMCNLIREMGGLPGISLGSQTNGARPHSAPEHGSRSAIRLLENSMLPAWPRGYTEGGDDPKNHLRVDCTYTDGTDGCVPCDPRSDANCDVIPMITIVLSDEEDFWAKDDCMPSGAEADKRQLPSDCVYYDPCPALTSEQCGCAPGDTICAANPSVGTNYAGYDFCWWNGASCAHSPEIVPVECPVDYCIAEGFMTDPPTGYLPDSTAQSSSASLSLKWRDAGAAECSPLAADLDQDVSATPSCLGDPCPTFTNQADCDGGSAQHAFCAWKTDQNRCINQCANYTYIGNGVPPNPGERANQRAACIADDFCRWDESLIEGPPQSTSANQVQACQMKHPLNDCQACKRLFRTLQAADDLGLGGNGHVYSIIRDAGEPGYGGFSFTDPQDECEGGFITWGRGDGQMYRDLAIATQGRTQNICAANYKDFMQTVIRDISVLSAPYPLTGRPIASTIKVGLARPKAGGGFASVSVPRSSRSGFFYNSDVNSIGFQSTPIDGECGNGDPCDTGADCGGGTCGGGTCSATCSEDGTLEQSEILYARTAPHVPRDTDLVYISYRLWRPVPCSEECADSQTCARVLCVTETDPGTCPNGLDNECPFGYTCTSNNCTLDCTPGELIDVCIDGSVCGPCEEFNTDVNACQAIGDLCLCNPLGGQLCNPSASQSECEAGFFCDESCVCVQNPGCPGGFNPDGSVADCDAAKACCETWADEATACAAHLSEGACDGGVNCDWSGTTCTYGLSTCCGDTETIDCQFDLETGDGFILCSDTCVCSPACAFNQYCEQQPGLGCQCVTIAP